MFESLREWVPGDESRTIDWKATARRGKLIARQYEEERRQRIIIAIDAGRMLTAETDGRPRLEDAIEAAAQLAHHAVRLDDDVGLMVFAAVLAAPGTADLATSFADEAVLRARHGKGSPSTENTYQSPATSNRASDSVA